ncbi:MAG: ATP-binding protein [Chloroflexales bacterium]|nr:ATP-binding protein [Chloroflexales bacterium]
MALTLRLTLTYVLITLGGVLLLGGGFVVLTSRYVAQQREQELVAQADIYASFLSELVQSSAELQALAPDLVQSGVLPAQVTVRLFASNGRLLSASADLGPFPSLPVLTHITSSLPLPASQSPDRRYVARLIPGATAPSGIVELSHTTSAERQLQANLRQLIIQAALVATLVMVFISLLIARTIARPIVQLTHHARVLAYSPAPTPELLSARPQRYSLWQRFVRRLPGWRRAQKTESRDEIALLAQSLYHMAEQLQARIAETDLERTRLSTVLSAISEGVVALDATGALIFANPAANTLLQVPDQEAIPQRLADLDLLRLPASPVEQEIMIGQRYVLVSINPVAASDLIAPSAPSSGAVIPQSVLVMRDITRLKELEQARNRFFRSVSHDRRTPLAAIRGMLENLHDTASPAEQATLATLEEEAARLSRLVDELLHPSSSGALLLSEQRRIHLGGLAQELCALQQGRARRAGVTLSCQVAADLSPIMGDRDRIKQALLNLLDNAMRVIPAGGSVSVDVVQPDNSVIQARVTDNGPGVPPALRGCIWERGLRGADLDWSAGASVYGGAGLGLAIVREIMTAHGGRALFEAVQPHGACFVLEFPIAA